MNCGDRTEFQERPLINPLSIFLLREFFEFSNTVAPGDGCLQVTIPIAR